MAKFAVSQEEQYCIIQTTEEAGDKLDALLSPELKSLMVQVSSDGNKFVILDMSSFRYCDSSGLSGILIGNRLCKEAGGSFVLAEIQPMVSKLIEISQLNNVLNITPTMDEARQFITMEIVEGSLGEEE